MRRAAAVEWALELIRGLGERSAWADGLAIDIVPVVNPWGREHDIRHNADGATRSSRTSP